MTYNALIFRLMADKYRFLMPPFTYTVLSVVNVTTIKYGKVKFCFVFCRLLLVIAIVCCCGVGYFIRRRVHTYTLHNGPDFNVTFTRHPILSPGEPIFNYFPTL